MNCIYCNREFSNKGGLASHSPYCMNNPNRVQRKKSKNAHAKKGSIPWNKGVKTPIDTRKKIGKSLIGKSKGTASSFDMELERINKIKESMKKNPNSGGLRIGSGRGIKTWYDSPIAGRVYLRSSYELEYAKWLDKNKINWKINTDFFYYTYDNKVRKYYPDFYLIDSEFYIETKGFKTKQDEEKWKAVDNLKVLYKKDLNEIGILI